MIRIMKHYCITTIKALCLATLLSSCGSDDEGSNSVPTSISQLIQAEWYAPDVARYMSFEFMYVTGAVYDNLSDFPEIAESFSGQWAYYRGGVLDMNIVYDKSLVSVMEDYYVLQCDDNTLKLRHWNLGLTFDFYKIVESYKVRIGDRFDIVYAKIHPDYSTATYSTSNANIADVDSNGHVIIRGSGLAFITVSSAAGSVVVKVDGGQRVNSYTAAITETIDQVIERHGEPDLTSVLTTGTMAAFYGTSEKIIDHAVSQLGYAYDPDTREVTLVEVIYKQEADKWFQSDEDYLSREFYPYLNYQGIYAPNYSLLENHFYVEVVKNETRFGLSICNRDYVSKHGHY